MNYKEVKEIKNDAQKVANKGFKHFMKNAGMILLIILVTFIITNPAAITNPSEFFKNFSVQSLWVVMVLFFALCGFYQLARSVNSDNRAEQGKEIINDYQESVEQQAKRKEEEHKELVKHRIEITPMISNILKDIIINLGASRATVCEMHNGTNNFSGVPFVYLDCAYEEIDPGEVDYVCDEFKNFNLSKYPFISNHFEQGTWIGSLAELDKEDPHLGAKLKFADVGFCAQVVLHGTKAPLGILTVSFKDAVKHPTKTEIIAELNEASQKISTLLDRD